MALSLLNLNIERNKHWEQILPFLSRTMPDVICVQEIFDHERERIETLGYTSAFAFISTQLVNPQDVTSGARQGVALFSKTQFVSVEEHAYYRAPYPEKPQSQVDASAKRETTDHRLLVGVVSHEGQHYTIGTTHFTWTPDGSVSPEQERDMVNLLMVLARYPSLILTGDFNIPRATHPLYTRLTERLIDHIPHDIQSSIDLSLHRAGKTPGTREKLARFMVDYIFSTHHFAVTNVTMHCGLSDHCAFSALITKHST